MFCRLDGQAVAEVDRKAIEYYPVNIISLLLDEADDYVYDVKWHPSHPAVFGTVDGSGKFDLWNLNMDTEVCLNESQILFLTAVVRQVPVVSTPVGANRAINKLEWDRKDGRRAALGSSDGKLYIYDIGDMAIPESQNGLTCSVL